MEHKPKELCSIRIMFPVTSDEQAIQAKKQVAEALKDIEGVQTQFSIMGTSNGVDIRPANKSPMGQL